MSSISGFPTSSDIYLEIEGRKVAIVQSYNVKSTQSSIVVEAFGESEPVATSQGQQSHTITLSRLYATDDAIRDGISFHQLSDFSVVICKPDRRVIFGGCQWTSISEEAKVSSMVAEQMTCVAKQRIETKR